MRTGGHLAAPENQKLANFIEREAKFLSTTNELNTVHIVCAEEPEPSFRSRRMFEELLLLIETDGVNGKPCLPRHLPNLEPLHHSGFPYSAYTLEWTPESSLSLGWTLCAERAMAPADIPNGNAHGERRDREAHASRGPPARRGMMYTRAPFVAHHDAPRIGERAATCGRSATEGGDERAGAKRAFSVRGPSLAN